VSNRYAGVKKLNRRACNPARNKRTVPFKQTAPGQFSLLGRPLTITEKLPPLGQPGDLLFADLSRYCVGMRKEIGIERSIHAGWQNYSEKFRLIMRLDGAPKDSVAVTPISGSDSFSWAVAIGAR
jgi:HK97 family phage major capsid protein